MFFRGRRIIHKSKSVLPQGKYQILKRCRNERMSLCTLQKGSLTVEAALVLPFFLFMLLAFFDLFGQYVQAAELQMEAAAEAKTVGIVKGAAGSVSSGRIVIVKSRTADRIVKVPFRTQERIFARAVCRAWIGFRGREDEEVYVYITPDGEVYHLYADCTHLELSIRQAPFDYAVKAKNVYGENTGSADFAGKNSVLGYTLRRRGTVIIRKEHAAD